MKSKKQRQKVLGNIPNMFEPKPEVEIEASNIP